MNDDRTNTPARTHPDAAFVRRCRVVCVAAIRFALLALAVVLASNGLYVVESVIASAYYGSSLGLGWLWIIAPIGQIVGLAFLWWLAPWISRRLVPSPPDPGRCPKCKYPLEGLDADNCPECGTRIR
ncbi:MAG: hypothetical protein R3B68_02635 [Phycisphaerales bacterium]